MTTAITGYIDTAVTIGTGTYTSPLTITTHAGIKPNLPGEGALYGGTAFSAVQNDGVILAAAGAGGTKGTYGTYPGITTTPVNGGPGGNGGAGSLGGAGIILTHPGSILNIGTIAGGKGGNGGEGGEGGWGSPSYKGSAGGNNGTGGNGGVAGNGNAGVILTRESTLANSGTITGGSGGYGGMGNIGGYSNAAIFGKFGASTNGGYGGAGVTLSSYGGYVTDSGVITGGNGGGGAEVLHIGNGDNVYYGAPGNAGNGAAGIAAAYGTLNITATGSVAGGTGGQGSTSFYSIGDNPISYQMIIKAGNGGAGIIISHDAAITNAGLITGGAGGAGIISGAGASGVVLTAGNVINTGTISGGSTSGYAAAAVQLANGTLMNSGTIEGGDIFKAISPVELSIYYHQGLAALLGNAATVISNAGAVLSGGAVLTAATSNLINSGTILGSYEVQSNNLYLRQGGGGVYLNAGSFTNETPGIIEAGPAAIGLSFNNLAYASNHGTIIGGTGENGLPIIGATGGLGVTLTGGGTLTNTGTIIGGTGGTAGTGGIGVSMAAGTLTNAGLITGGAAGTSTGSIQSSAGVLLTGGTIFNTGTISGGPNTIASFSPIAAGTSIVPAGVELADGTLINSGKVEGSYLLTPRNYYFSGLSALIGNAATVINHAGGVFEGGVDLIAANSSLINAGAINGTFEDASGSAYTVTGGTAVYLAAGSLTNQGDITGGHGNQGAAGNGGTGLAITGGGVTNSGLIAGGYGGSNLPGLTFVDGGAGGTAVSLSGGGTFSNTGTLLGGAGGAGSYNYGPNPAFNGGNGGAGIYLNGGVLLDAGQITGGAGGAGGNRYQNGNIYPSGTSGAQGDAVAFGTNASTLIVQSGASFQGAVALNPGAADLLDIASPASTLFTVTGFGSLDTVILDDFAATSETYVTGTGLILQSATGAATLDLTGNFVTGNFSVSGSQNTTIEAGPVSFIPVSIVNGLVTSKLTPGYNLYATALTITATGTAAPAASAVAGYGADGVDLSETGTSLFNAGTVQAAAGKSGVHDGGATIASIGGNGGIGVVLAAPAYLFNGGTITGGTGGAGLSRADLTFISDYVLGSGTFPRPGNGGAGLALAAGASAVSNGLILGGAGGFVAYDANGGNGGVGVSISGGSNFTNSGTVMGGAGADGGVQSSALYNFYHGGNGGAGVYLNGGVLDNAGLISGGAGKVGIPVSLKTLMGTDGAAVTFGTAASTLIVQSGASFYGAVSLNGNAADLLDITSPAAADFTIGGFGTLDTIILGNFAATTDDYVTGTGLVLQTSGSAVTLDITGSFTTTDFNLTGSQNTTITLDAICYRRGTHILTPTGEKPIEDLAIGDDIITWLGGTQKIKWIGRQTFAPRFVAKNASLRPIQITAGALGGGLPVQDLFVSAGHSLLLKNTLVLASTLMNGLTITEYAATRPVEYFNIELETHDCIMAEGAWCETYADGPGLRANFHNAAEFWALYPDYQTPASVRLCAPRPETGPELEAALRAPTARAAVLTPGPLLGFIDICTPEKITGWARDAAHPHLPVKLEILLGETLITTILACDTRDDLAGRPAFTVNIPDPLTAFELASLKIRRAGDHAELFTTQRQVQAA